MTICRWQRVLQQGISRIGVGDIIVNSLSSFIFIFKPEQVLVLPMRKLLCEHDKTIKTVFSFLGVDSMVTIPQEIIFSYETSKNVIPLAVSY